MKKNGAAIHAPLEQVCLVAVRLEAASTGHGRSANVMNSNLNLVLLVKADVRHGIVLENCRRSRP